MFIDRQINLSVQNSVQKLVYTSFYCFYPSIFCLSVSACLSACVCLIFLQCLSTFVSARFNFSIYDTSECKVCLYCHAIFIGAWKSCPCWCRVIESWLWIFTRYICWHLFNKQRWGMLANYGPTLFFCQLSGVMDRLR